jgi:hypothetical protein
MKRMLWVFLVLFLAFRGYADPYEVFEENGKVGLKDQRGNVVLPASFEALGWSDRSFSMAGEVTGYKRGERWGLINLKKEFITAADYEALTYSGGDRVVARKKIDAVNYKLGCINLSGNITVPFQYDGIKIIGLRAIVFVKDGNQFRFGLIDLENKNLIPLKYKLITGVGSLRYAVENVNSKTALFSEQGNQITDFTIDSISSFRQGMAFIYQEFRRGLIDREGEIKLQPLYRNILIAPDGSISVQKADEWIIVENGNKEIKKVEADVLIPSGENYKITLAGKTGLIDREFNVKIPIVYDYLGEFKDGKAVAAKNKKYGIIRSDNSLVLPFESDSIILQDAFIRSQKDFFGKDAWSLYDTFGILKTQRNYEKMTPYNGRYFAVRNYGYYGAIDRYGKEIVHCVFDSLLEFRGEQLAVKFKGQYAIIDLQENWILMPRLTPVKLVSNELFLEQQQAVFFLKDFKGGIVYFTSNEVLVKSDHLLEKLADGREKKVGFDGRVIEPETPTLIENTQFIFPESEGLRGILKNGKYGFVDARGRLRIANRYEAISPFREGLAAVKILGKWGYISPADKIVINPTYTSASLFEQGVAIVERVGMKGMINAAGDILLPPRYDQIERLTDQLFLLTHKQLKGLADAKGNVLIEPRFDRLEDLRNGHVLVARDGKYGVLTLEGLSTIPLQYDNLIYDRVKDQFLAQRKSPWVTNP